MNRYSRLLIVVLGLWGCLPALAFDGIRLTLLGAGSVGPGVDRPGPAALVEAGAEVMLFDCGAGTLGLLRQSGVPVRDLTAVFLTSLDPAHIAGCAELVRQREQLGMEEPLPIWGPNGTAELINAWHGTGHAPKPGDAIASQIVENIVYRTDDATVTAFVADFPPQKQAYGYRVDQQRRAIALLAGTRYTDNVAHGAQGVQVLVHEAVAADPQYASRDPAAQAAMESQTSPEESARLFRGAHPQLAIYSRLRLFGVSEEDAVRRTRRYYGGALEVGRDPMIVEIQNEVQLRSAPSDGRRIEPEH